MLLQQHFDRAFLELDHNRMQRPSHEQLLPAGAGAAFC
jgi:hypothetical protein